MGKLLVVAPDQAQARRYLDTLRRWVPPGQADTVALTVSEVGGDRRVGVKEVTRR